MSEKNQQAEFNPANRRISVCAKRFFAAWQFISDEETRYYLNGVYIEPHPDGGVIMTATDGHTLASVRDQTAYIEGTGGWICGLPKKPFHTSLKLKDAGTLHFVGRSAYLTNMILGRDATLPNFDPTIITHVHMAIAYANPIDGTFPDWRRVIPTNFAEQSERISVDMKLLERFKAAILPLQDEKKAVGINIATPPDDASPIIIHADAVPDFFGVVMPRAHKSNNPRLPDWLGLPKADAKPEPANDAKPAKPAKAQKKRPALGLTQKPTVKTGAV